MPIFFIFYFTDWYRDENILHSVILLGGLHGGVDVKYIVWRLTCSWSCMNVIVVRVKVRGGIVPFSLMGIDSTDTSQPPNGEIYKDKSHLHLNNPARTSVPIETAEKYLH
jgi:hypothetical protein